MKAVDLNCDLGEGCGNDREIMKYISSANIACGFHAGTASTMRVTAEMAVENGVAIGAHPSFPDRENFGRLPMSLPLEEIFDIVLHQVGAMAAVCRSVGTRLRHVKPHGALYNQSANDAELAAEIAKAVKAVDEGLVLYGLSGSLSIAEAEKVGLRTASEVFADRTYCSDGRLTPRSEPNALIDDIQGAVEQVLQMVLSENVTSTERKALPIVADTVCIHGDGPHAVEFAKALREALSREGIAIQSVNG